jgi:O-antigen ligase
MPTAARERDLGWAHNEFLQQGAETGIIGLALVLALLGWVFWRLWNAGTAAAAVAALGLSAIVIHACADYVFHFPLLPATTAALVGSASMGKRVRV